MLNISVGDVWQLAAEISSNLERLTNEIGIDKIQGVVTPTVRALELLEKLADERTKLIEEKLIQDQVIDSLRQKNKAQSDENDNTTETDVKTDDHLHKFLEGTIKQKNEENIELTKKLAENQMNGVSQGDELERQRKSMDGLERRVTELSDELRIKESTIAELERDCDTLENEANRLLNINRDLRGKYGDESMVEVQQEQSTQDEASFANEIILDGEWERPGPEGSEETMDASKNDIFEPNEETKPRYTLLELEEVLNEKNKYKERCFVLEEKLRDLTGDEIIIWQGQSDTNDLEVVEHSGGGHPNQRQAMQQPGSIRNLMTKFFRSPTAPPPQSPLITNSEHHQIVSTQ